jgi:malonyl CoA-acyl carrier protein transacylase
MLPLRPTDSEVHGMLTTQARPGKANATPSTLGKWDTELLVVHGRDRTALQQAVEDLANHCQAHPETNLAHLAYTLNTNLPAGGCRLAVVAANTTEAAGRLELAAGRLADTHCRSIRDAAGIYYAEQPLHPEGKVAFLFPGEGAQYLGMLADVRAAFPEVASFFAECDAALVRVGGRPLSEVFLLPEGAGEEERGQAEAALQRLDNAMMSVVIVDWALAQLLQKLGIRPDVVAGHSMGELIALWAAGALEADVQFLAHIRAGMEAMQRQEEEAGGDTVLLAVGAGREALVGALAELGGPPVTVAMDNCPHQAVVVGPPGPMAAVETELQNRRLVCERLPFRRPYHTPDFAPLLEPIKDIFESVGFRSPRLPVYSCTTGHPFPNDPDEVRRLAVAHWAEPVRFTELVKNLYAEGVRFFVEAGPRGNLSAFVEDILRGRSFVALPANLLRRSGITQLHHLLACLAAHHVPLHLDALYQHRDVQRLELFRNGKPQEVSQPARAEPPHASRSVPGDGRGQVLAQYLGVMEQFLDLQRDMTELFLRRGQFAAPRRPIDQPSGTTGAPPVVAKTPARPMLGVVVRQEPNREIVLHRVFKLDEDCFAADHTIGGRCISKVDPNQHGLPIIPMTFTLEMMAEAAAALVPDKVVIAVRKVQLFRWLELAHEDQRTVEVVARVADTEGPIFVEAEVRDLGTALRPSPSPLSVARVTLVMDSAYPAPPPPSQFPSAGARPPTVTLEQMYLNLFHGPLFNGARSLDWFSDEAIEAQVEVLPRDRLFRSIPAPDLVLDPVLLDVVMHPVAAWHLEHPNQAGRILLPVAVEGIELFGPPLPPGTRLTSRGWITETSVRSFVHDVEAVTADGRLWARLEQVKYWRFYVPFSRVNFHGPKDQYFLSQRWTEVETQCRPGAGGAFAVVRLEPPTDLQHPGLNRVAAQVALTPSELEAFRQLPPRDTQTKEWLFDRMAAKDAVRMVWRELHEERLFPADIDTISKPKDLYQARRRGSSDQWFSSAAVATAGPVTVAVSLAGAPVLGVALDVLSAVRKGESALVATVDNQLLEGWDGDRAEAAIRLRCACRAVVNSLGLRPDHTCAIRACRIEASGCVTVAIRKDLGPGERELEDLWLAHTARDGDLIVAVALGERQHS